MNLGTVIGEITKSVMWALVLIFSILKLTNVIKWSWVLVTSPVWGMWIFGIVGILFLVTLKKKY